MPSDADLPDAAPASDARRPLYVLKFGGTSVGSPERFRRAVGVVTRTARQGRVVVVASALARVTRQLSNALEAFTTHPLHQASVQRDLLEALRTRHLGQAAEVLLPDAQAAYADVLDERLNALDATFDRVRADGFSPRLRDVVLATGEQCAVPMLALALQDAGLDAALGDATTLIATDAAFGDANVRLDATRAQLRDWHAALAPEAVGVVAGYLGRAPNGATTTLGFEGSDYSASLVAAMLGARRLTRYTDVPCLYTRDPRTHADAEPIRRLAMERAFAMTESGHLGMHPKTLRPLVEAHVAMHVRCIDDPEAPGTAIVPND
jgi:aspartate kinase